MRNRAVWIAVLLAGVAGIGGIVTFKRLGATHIERPAPTAGREVATTPNELAMPPVAIVESSAPAPAESASVTPKAPSLPASQFTPERPAPRVPAGPSQGQAGQSTQDELARVALSLVGLDPEAEEYWAEAINDPALPAEERQNLIEDLNEDGLSDPKHPGFEDLPVILNRLRLIEMMAGDAMDKVNADAFLEAYKDLVNLAHLAAGTGQGQPVR